MPAGRHGDGHPDALLEQPAPPGAPQSATRTKSRPAPPSKEALLHIERFDRVAAEVFRSLDGVVSYEFEPLQFNFASLPPPRRPYPGPGAMSNVGIPGGPPLANRLFFLALGARIPGFPSRGELLGLGPAGGLPPNEPPSLCT